MHAINNVLSYANYYAEWMARDATSALDALQKDCKDNEQVMQGILLLIASVHPRSTDSFMNYKQELQTPNFIDSRNEYEVEFRGRRTLTEERLKSISVMVRHGKLDDAVNETLTAVSVLLEFSIVLTDQSDYLPQRFDKRENRICNSIKQARTCLNNLNVSIVTNDRI